MNRSRPSAAPLFIFVFALAGARAETEAEMRARTAAEYSRRATAADVQALDDLSRALHNPDAWKSREQLEREYRQRQLDRAAQTEADARRAAARQADEKRRTAAEAEYQRNVTKQHEGLVRRLNLRSELERRQAAGDLAAIIAVVNERVTGNSAIESGETEPDRKNPAQAWREILPLEGEFRRYRWHWAGTFDALFNKERRLPHFIDPSVYDGQADIDAILGFVLDLAACDAGPSLSAGDLQLYQTYAAAELNARLATPPNDWQGPQLTAALAALARRAQVHHSEIAFSPAVLAAIEQALADARAGKIVDPFRFHAMTYPSAAPVPTGVVPAPPLNLSARVHLAPLFAEQSPRRLMEIMRPHYEALGSAAAGAIPAPHDWLNDPVARQMLRLLSRHQQFVAHQQLKPDATFEQRAEILMIDALCECIDRPPAPAVAAAWRQHAKAFTTWDHGERTAASTVQILEDVAAHSPPALLLWFDAQTSAYRHRLEGENLARFCALALRAPALFVTSDGCRAVLRHLGEAETLTVPAENRAAFASLLKRCAALELNDEDKSRLLLLRARGLGDDDARAAVLSAAEQAEDLNQKFRLFSLAVELNAPEAADRILAAADALESEDDKLRFADLAYCHRVKSAGADPEKIRAVLHLLRKVTLPLERDQISKLSNLDLPNTVPALLDSLRRADSPSSPGDLPLASTAQRFYGNTLGDHLAKLVGDEHDAEFFQLGEFAREEARTSYQNTAGKETLAAELLRSEGGTPTELSVFCSVLEAPSTWPGLRLTQVDERFRAEYVAARLLLLRLKPPSTDDKNLLRAGLTGLSDFSQPMHWELMGRDLAVGGIATRFLLYLHRNFPDAEDKAIDFDSSLTSAVNGPALLPGRQIVRELTAAALGNPDHNEAPWPRAALALGTAAAPVLRSTLDLMHSLEWRRAALAAIDEHAAQLPLTEESWPAGAPKDQQATALRARVRWELAKLDQPALAAAARAQPIAAGLGARAALVAFLYPANDNITPARQLLFEGDRNFGRALLAAANLKNVPDRDELLRRFDALDHPRTDADWAALVAGKAW